MKKYERKRFLRAIDESRSGALLPAVQQQHHQRALSEASALVPAGGSSRAALETSLKSRLLGSNGTALPYDKTVPPDGPNGPSGGGTNVEIGINIYHLFGLNMGRAALSLHVWLRMRWKDDRLAWDPAEYGDLDTITFIASAVSIEESQIWTPEVELYEAAASDDAAPTTYDMPRKEVIVKSDGTCWWSRPGTIASICELEGLSDFPYDRVMCKMRFGGWTLGGSAQNLTEYSGGAIDALQLSAATYQEYKVVDTGVRRGVDTFSCCPDGHGWPFVEFTIKLSRAAKHYELKIIVTNIVLTYLSFGVFFLDPRTGERIQTSVTILLTIVAADALVTGVVPTCSPMLWIEYFYMVCWCFVAVTIVANVVTHVLFYMKMSEVFMSSMPRIAYFLERRCRRRPRGADRPSFFMEGSAISPDVSPDRARRSQLTSMHGSGSKFGSGSSGSSGSSSQKSSARALALGGGGGGSCTQIATQRTSFERASQEGSIGSMLLRSKMMRRQGTNVLLEPNSMPQSPYGKHGRRSWAIAARGSIGLVQHGGGGGGGPARPSLPSYGEVEARAPPRKMFTSSESVTDEAADRIEGTPSAEGGADHHRQLVRYASKEPSLATIRSDGESKRSCSSSSETSPMDLEAQQPSAEATCGEAAAGADAAAAGKASGKEASGKVSFEAKAAAGSASAQPRPLPVDDGSPAASPSKAGRDLATGDDASPSPSRSSGGRRRTVAYARMMSTIRRASLWSKPRTARNLVASVMPFGGAAEDADANKGAFVNAEDLAENITAMELDPVQASLVRKAFRLLDSMSARLGVLGPAQLEYFAHHMGRLPKDLASAHDENHDGLWSIEEFSTLCVALIKLHGDEKFKVLVEGLLESYEHRGRLFQVYWEGWALFWDFMCICILIPSYTLALFVLFYGMRDLTEQTLVHEI